VTERLYYRDANLLEFDGRIVAIERDGDRFVTTLDRSAFYPTSGGQLHDLGQLGAVAVVDVTEDADGTIRHHTNEAVGEVGQTVPGVIDSQRRKRHRQQHTAQHIISQVFIELFGFETVSVHLGEEYGAIELETPDVSPGQLLQVEQPSGDIVFANWPVEIMFVDAEKAKALPLRKVPQRAGTIRVVKIDDFDYSACGGTHCDSTAQVGLLKIIGVEKMRGHALVKFLVGTQTLADYTNRLQVTGALANALTCHVDDLVGRTSALTEENRSLRHEVGRLQRELLPLQVDKLAASARTIGRLSAVLTDIGPYDSKLLGSLAGQVAEKIDGVAALISETRLVIAAAPSVDLHTGKLVGEFASTAGVKGGGGPTQAQAGGLDPARTVTYIEAIETLLRDA